jgi:FKBP-type peptidyl-prolyl cis-trans isomerase 2/SAM-dependent methyltransferase
MDYSKRITQDSLIDLIFHLKWKSGSAIHTDVYQDSRVNVRRDFLPQVIPDALMGKEAGERLEVPIANGDLVGPFSEQAIFSVHGSQFDRRFRQQAITEPRLGRFYPKGMLKGIAGVFKDNLQPFRCVGLENGRITVDFNHPLAGKDVRLSAVVGQVASKSAERGGTSGDRMERLTAGPGMQARWQGRQTDYFSGGGFVRDDEKPDMDFYRKPRFVYHIDDTARDVVRNTYGRFLADGMHVLDLMSSWQSHIPAGLTLGRLVGLGLNEKELKRNAQLSEHRVSDLNTDADLPFESNSFDVVVNTVSVEYLTNPIIVFREVCRVLRPEGYFVITFSNRWFPTKAIRIWHELHEFERMGLVLEYFLRAGGFKDMQTYSIRGLPRPHDDKYYPELMFSDPVYAVWGLKR